MPPTLDRSVCSPSSRLEQRKLTSHLSHRQKEWRPSRDLASVLQSQGAGSKTLYIKSACAHCSEGPREGLTQQQLAPVKVELGAGATEERVRVVWRGRIKGHGLVPDPVLFVSVKNIDNHAMDIRG